MLYVNPLRHLMYRPECTPRAREQTSLWEGHCELEVSREATGWTVNYRWPLGAGQESRTKGALWNPLKRGCRRGPQDSHQTGMPECLHVCRFPLTDLVMAVKTWCVPNHRARCWGSSLPESSRCLSQLLRPSHPRYRHQSPSDKW